MGTLIGRNSITLKSCLNANFVHNYNTGYYKCNVTKMFDLKSDDNDDLTPQQNLINNINMEEKSRTKRNF